MFNGMNYRSENLLSKTTHQYEDERTYKSVVAGLYTKMP